MSASRQLHSIACWDKSESGVYFNFDICIISTSLFIGEAMQDEDMEGLIPSIL